MDLNPFEWGLPWYYYSIGALILIFTIVFFVIYISSRSKEAGPEEVTDYTHNPLTETGKENSSKKTISHDSEEYRQWKEGEED